MKSTRGMLSETLEPPGNALSSSKKQKPKETRRPVQLSGRNLIRLWSSDVAAHFNPRLFIFRVTFNRTVKMLNLHSGQNWWDRCS